METIFNPAYTAGYIIGALVLIAILFLVLYLVVSRGVASGMKKFIDKNGGTLVDVPSPTVVVSDHAEDSAEEIAAITAAVAAYLDQDPGSFMIKSFRRSGSAAWKKTSRDEQIYHA